MNISDEATSLAHLSNIRIVLVETTHPGNIGASARAMKTMGLSQLALCNPQRYPNVDATAMASGADDILHQALQVEQLTEALTDCRLVIGASARRRGLACPELDPMQAAKKLIDSAAQAPVALLFGRESSGLTNEELDLCHYMVRIPVSENFSSLNVAAAVQVLSYELRLAALNAARSSNGSVTLDTDHLPAPTEQLERFYTHLQQVLTATTFLNPDNPRHLMRRLRRLFNRAQPDQNEVNILRGILSSVESKIDHKSTLDN